MSRTDADILVVGSGAAGLSAVLAAAGGMEALSLAPTGAPDSGAPPSRILLVTRGRLGGDGASPMAQGGVAAALDAGDSPDLHALDTLLAGAGLSREDRVAILTKEGPDRVRELIGLGARFDRDAAGSLALAMEGAHSRRRVIHALGDRTGAEVTGVLTRAVRRDPRIQVLEGAEALDLIVVGGRAVGLQLRSRSGAIRKLRAPAVVLATGGPCHLYLRTTTPRGSTGDGLAIAARAGARLADMEFVQFHPTALAVDSDPLPLVTEAIRGEGAALVDRAGDPLDFPAEESELSSRDVVARTLWRHLRTGEAVFLDARDTPGADFPERFPGVFALCRTHGIDPRTALIPVTPAAHYHMGGIEVDEEGRSTLPGLWAAGEVASTGVHGANRLASNSLLEGLVFGARAGHSARRAGPRAIAPMDAPATPTVPAEPAREGPRVPGPRVPPRPDPGTDDPVFRQIRTLLWEEVGLVRDAEGLTRALSGLDRIDEETRRLEPRSQRIDNALLVARRITEAALARRESRGSHHRSDFPTPSPSTDP